MPGYYRLSMKLAAVKQCLRSPKCFCIRHLPVIVKSTSSKTRGYSPAIPKQAIPIKRALFEMEMLNGLQQLLVVPSMLRIYMREMHATYRYAGRLQFIPQFCIVLIFPGIAVITLVVPG